MFKFIKKILLNTVFQNGIIMKIIQGPLKNYKYIVKPDTGFSSLLGRWEKDTLIIYKNSIFNGDIVFDLGANFGIHSMYYSKLVQNKGKVFAFEPLKSNIKDLETHISINKINNIIIEPYAVSNIIETTNFKIANHGGQGSLLGIGKETGITINVNTTTLDSFCEKMNLYPDFVKIDIEGAEAQALEGFEKAIVKSYPFFAIDLHTPECDEAVGKFLLKHGYDVYRVIKASGGNINSDGKLIKKIVDLTLPYPHGNGIWGVIWAVHPTRKAKVNDFIQKNLE